MRKLPAFEDHEAQRILRKLCEQHSISEELVHQMAEVFSRYSGSGRAHGITQEFDLVLADFLRDGDEGE